METLELNNLKVEKRNLVNDITKTFRILKLCLALFFLSWLLMRLPFVLRLSVDYLRSPLFAFFASNAIIAALLAQFNSASPVAEAEHLHHQISDTWTDTDSGTSTDPNLGKNYSRSQSEKLKGNGEDENETARRELRRSETEKVREKSCPQDKLSNEEFRRTIEAFIAKQMRLLREESFGHLACN